MIKTLTAATLAASLLAGSAFAQDAKPAAAPAATAGKLSSDSTVAALLANEKSKAVIAKYVPIIVEYADMIPDLDKISLKVLGQNEQAQSAAGLTADVMKQIEADLAKL